MELHITEAAKLLGVSEEKIRELTGANKLPHHHVRGRVFYARSRVIQWAIENNHALNFSSMARPKIEVQPTKLHLLFRPEYVHYNVPGTDIEEALHSCLELVDLVSPQDKELIYDLLLGREKVMSTAIGDGIALPHTKIPILIEGGRAFLGVYFLKNSLKMGAIDGKPVNILILLLSLTPRQHLEVLSRLGYFLRDPEYIALLHKRVPAQTLIQWMKSREMNAGEAG